MASKYEYYDVNNDDKYAVYAAEWRAQTFTVGTVGTDEDHAIDSIKIYACKDGSPGTLTASIKAVDGSNKPTGADLSSGTVDADGFPSAWNFAMQTVSMSAYTLEASTMYALVIRCIDATAGNYAFWAKDKTSPAYTGGTGAYSSNSGSAWTLDTTVDTLFEIWGDPLGVEHTHAASDTLPISDSMAPAMVFGHSASDTLSLSETLAAVAAYKHSASDTLTISDALAAVASYKHSSSDTLTITDSLAAAIIKAEIERRKGMIPRKIGLPRAQNIGVGF